MVRMPSYEEISKQQQATWALGNFQAIAGGTVLAGELLCDAVGLRAGNKVLDVATGSGNTALSAAKESLPCYGNRFRTSPFGNG
jgi:ubiquinone/menaquinone biosynthesis C-methylase UbiE